MKFPDRYVVTLKDAERETLTNGFAETETEAHKVAERLTEWAERNGYSGTHTQIEFEPGE